MNLTILGGFLTPVLHDGTVQDLVYGCDAQGAYLGLVKAAAAAQVATSPPPPMGAYRWIGGAWQPFKTVEELAREIEAVRDTAIDAGVPWSDRTWYSDPTFQQQLAAFLQAFSEGILPADATVGIRARDKVVYQLTQSDLRQLAGTVMGYVQAAYAASWAAKAQIGAD